MADASSSLIVSASGIRGVVGRGLVPAVAARYGAALGAWLAAAGRTGPVLVGRDSRTSGPLLVDAAAAGLRAAGAGAVDLGIVPTPTALLAVQEDPEAAGALLVTASHNPVEWNGLKLGGPDGRFLPRASGAEVQRIYEAGPEHRGWDALGARTARSGAVERHLDRIVGLDLVQPERIAEAGFRVALDCVHGAGGVIMPALLDRLGCEVVGLGLEPDGHFPREPEPTAAHLGELGRAVRESGADLGLAVDPDVDRLALVDEEGRAVGEDWTLALCAELVLSSRPGPVVTNLSSSQCIRDAARRAGVPFHRAPVGEANVAARMEEVGAVIGGEGNGGVMLPALHLTRDAPLAAALVLQLLAGTGTRLGRLLAERPRYHMARKKAARASMPLEELYAALRRELPGEAETDRRDGLRLEWEDGSWLHVRPSGTEPVLRIMAEAEGAERAERLAAAAERVVERLG